MPCYVYEEPTVYVRHSDKITVDDYRGLEQQLAEAKETISKLTSEINGVSELLCTLCRVNPMVFNKKTGKFESILSETSYFKDLIEWWEEHQLIDVKRVVEVNLEYYLQKYPELTSNEVIRMLQLGIFDNVDDDEKHKALFRHYGYTQADTTPKGE